MIVHTLMKCCVQVKESKHFNIFLPGLGFIPCLNHITCKRHSMYLFLYRGYAWDSRAIIMGLWGGGGRFIHLYEISVCAVQVKV